MMAYLRSTGSIFLRYRHLLKNLVQRDITVKYRRSVLGLFWSILNPLFMMLIMTAVFSFMFRFEIEYFPVYLLSGQVMFNFFSEATNTAMTSIIGSSGLIKKVYIPKYIFPFAKVIVSLITSLLSLIPLLVVILIMGAPLTPWALLFPVPMIFMFLFALGAGMALASMVVFFRDIQHLYGLLVLALNYLTPIFYPIGQLPETMQFIVKFNPLYWYVGMFRQVITVGAAPTGMMWLMCTSWAALALVFGLLVMKKTQDRFILFI